LTQCQELTRELLAISRIFLGFVGYGSKRFGVTGGSRPRRLHELLSLSKNMTASPEACFCHYLRNYQ